MELGVKKNVLFDDLLVRSSWLLAQRNLESVRIVQSVSCNPLQPVE